MLIGICVIVVSYFFWTMIAQDKQDEEAKRDIERMKDKFEREKHMREIDRKLEEIDDSVRGLR